MESHHMRARERHGDDRRRPRRRRGVSRRASLSQGAPAIIDRGDFAACALSVSREPTSSRSGSPGASPARWAPGYEFRKATHGCRRDMVLVAGGRGPRLARSDGETWCPRYSLVGGWALNRGRVARGFGKGKTKVRWWIGFCVSRARRPTRAPPHGSVNRTIAVGTVARKVMMRPDVAIVTRVQPITPNRLVRRAPFQQEGPLRSPRYFRHHRYRAYATRCGAP